MSNFGGSGVERQQLSDQVQAKIAEMKQALITVQPHERLTVINELKDWLVAGGGVGAKTATGTQGG